MAKPPCGCTGPRTGTAPATAEPTLRQLVERFAEDNGVELLPKAGRRQDGLQVGGGGSRTRQSVAARDVSHMEPRPELLGFLGHACASTMCRIMLDCCMRGASEASAWPCRQTRLIMSMHACRFMLLAPSASSWTLHKAWCARTSRTGGFRCHWSNLCRRQLDRIGSIKHGCSKLLCHADGIYQLQIGAARLPQRPCVVYDHCKRVFSRSFQTTGLNGRMPSLL